MKQYKTKIALFNAVLIAVILIANFWTLTFPFKIALTVVLFVVEGYLAHSIMRQKKIMRTYR